MSRKLKYSPDFPAVAEGYARRGMSDEQIAKHLGISTRVYYEYQKKYPQFREAIVRGKRPVDLEVENALLKIALGGVEVIERRIETDSEGRPLRQTIIKKVLPPDAAACKFYLQARQPKIWNERLVTAEAVASSVGDRAAETAAAVEIVEQMSYEERKAFLREIAGVKEDGNS